jgi:FkbM family methyltransferase
MSVWRKKVQEFAFNRLNISISRSEGEGYLFGKSHLRLFFRKCHVDCVFDVGANEGQYRDLIRSIGFKGPIFSFEPIPELAEKLHKRAESDGRWIIEQVALDETIREAEFNIMLSSDFSSLKSPRERNDGIFSEINKSTRSIHLKTDILANYMIKHRTKVRFFRPFLKIDTQGNDLAIAKGARNSLHEFIGVQTELAVRPLYNDQPTFRETIDFFERNGFAVSSFLPHQTVFPFLVEVDCIFVNTDLFFQIRAEKRAETDG